MRRGMTAAMARWFLVMSAGLGALGVLLGAFGAHALRGRLTPALLKAYETGVMYHFFHVLALALVALLMSGGHVSGATPRIAGWAFLAGVVLFSGSLYALSVTGAKVFGPITPLGGVCFIVGWVALAVAALRM